MCKFYTWLAHLLSAVGAINWGLVYFFKFNLVGYIAAMTGLEIIAGIIYAAIAVSGIVSFLALLTPKMCNTK